MSSGNNNILIGTDATTDTFSGGTSTAIGIGQGVKPGTFDIAIGFQALQNTGGDNLDNIAIGFQSLQSNTTGEANVASGIKAMQSNTTGGGNVASGFLAMQNNTTGINNVASGSEAMLSNSTGSNNVASGTDAAFSNGSDTGNNNVAIGNEAFGFDSDGIRGTDNISIGDTSAQDITTGNSNVAVGSFSLGMLTTGNANTVLGDNVASTTLVSGSNNILIGTGSAVDTPTATTNNFLNIGNLIYGVNIGTAASPGMVGIGTTSPMSELQVNGGEVQIGSSGASCSASNAGALRYSGGSLFYCNGSAWTASNAGGMSGAAGSTGQVQFNTGGALAADAGLFWDNTNKHLGIGTASPAAPLHVYNANNYAPSLTYGSPAGAIINNGAQDLAFGTTTSSPFAYWLQVRNASAAGVMSLNPLGGNVGIGTTNPSDALTVEHASGGLGVSIKNDSDSSSDFAILRFLQGGAQKGTVFTNQENLVLRSNAGSLLLNDTGGNVGIGTTSPANILTINTSGSTLAAGAAGVDIVGDLNNERFAAESSSAAVFETGGYNGTYNARTATTAGQVVGDFQGGGYNGSAQKVNEARMQVVATENHSATNNGTALYFQTTPNGSTFSSIATRMVIDNTGNVGIGTTSPSQLLSIVGSDASMTVADTGHSGRITTLGYKDGFNFSIDNPGGDVLLNQSGGNVGIGTTSPADALDVQTSTTNHNVFTALSTAGNTIARILDTTNQSGWLSLYDNNQVEQIRLASNGSSYFTGGNVGIGTTSPGSLLTVAGSEIQSSVVDTGIVGTNSSGFTVYESQLPTAVDQRLGFLIFGANTGGTQRNNVAIEGMSGAAWTDGSSYPSYIRFSTTAASATSRSERMRIDQNGNVGIGTTSPVASMEVFSSRQGAPSLTSSANTTAEFASTISTALDIGNDSTSPFEVWLQTKRYTNDGSTWALAINPLGGNVGIGTTTPAHTLDVNGAVGFQTSLFGNGKDIIDTGDSYLRINQGSASASGIWLGSSPLRMDNGNFDVGSQGGVGEVEISGTNGDATNRITINGNAGANSWFNAGGNFGVGLPSPHGPLDVSTNLNGTINAANGVSDGIVFYQSVDNSSTIQSYIDAQWSNRTTYGGPCCNSLNIETDVGSVVIGNNTADNGITLIGVVTLSGGNLNFTAANPSITSGGSYISIPNGLYVSGGPALYSQVVINARAAIANDSASYLQINGGTSGYTYVNGSLGIGTTGPLSALDVVGAIYSRSNNAGSATSINWATGNVASTTASCGAFTFTNMQDGGSYTLAVQGTTAGTCSFSQSGLTFRSAQALTSTASTQTIFTFVRIGSTVYVSMIAGT
jgi:hypothetical protein